MRGVEGVLASKIRLGKFLKVRLTRFQAHAECTGLIRTGLDTCVCVCAQNHEIPEIMPHPAACCFRLAAIQLT